jgi:hypothetical protein
MFAAALDNIQVFPLLLRNVAIAKEARESRIAFSGVRNSWLMFANELLARLAVRGIPGNSELKGSFSTWPPGVAARRSSVTRPVGGKDKAGRTQERNASEPPCSQSGGAR